MNAPVFADREVLIQALDDDAQRKPPTVVSIFHSTPKNQRSPRCWIPSG
jgi:hypothetical protein